MSESLTITGLGQKGEGIAQSGDRKIFVPFALPGETVAVEETAERARLVAVETASPDRIEPFCPYFGACGGCQLQHMGPDIYRAFKIGLVETPLRHLGIEAKVERMVEAHGEGRRRATLHARRDAAGYMRLRSHDLLDIAACPILAPGLKRAPAIAHAIGVVVGPCDIGFTATETGIDVVLRPESKDVRADRLVPLANSLGLARLALHKEMVFLAQAPRVSMGRASVELPVGSFLQATAAAEAALADYVIEAVGKAKSVADLFCGVGPFALRLAEKASVFAADSDKPATVALEKAARHAKGLKAVSVRARDLFRDPLTRFELDYDCVVLDPPRAGCEAQVKEIVASKLKRVVMVACDPKTFARDAASLIKGGFSVSNLMAFDQFAWSNHIEIAATFSRTA
ncbi:hypothetical protein VW35_09335 [Devosia soli]|uniref:TRAM domain-containing protein n=1 Tax=Devosia soli TaxID=361041 RepID=A0A0F5L937_9HYPH|nr:methyltransferase [Devosia soli]KKB78709.1 hypothetical protein VW35_09335 [Devosia soli]